MRLMSLGAVAGFTATALAFQDTSPFLLFSDYQSGPVLQKSVQSSKTVLSATKDFLKSCPSRSYVIVHQQSAGFVDLADVTRSAAKHMSSQLLGQQTDHPTSIRVSEVAGSISSEEIRDFILENCQVGKANFDTQNIVEHQETSDFELWRFNFPTPSSDENERAAESARNDKDLVAAIGKVTANYTIIYTTTPLVDNLLEPPAYEPEFMQPLHTEMKRESDPLREVRDNSTIRHGAPLFEKYQFFTPGLFMGLIVAFILIAILSVGLRAISSISVSYGAFDKEMGPAAQRKQQ